MNSFSEKRRAGLITEEGKNICPPNKIVQKVFDIKTLLQMFMNTVLKQSLLNTMRIFKSSKMSVQIRC